MTNIIQIDDAIPRAYQDQIQAELGSSRMTWFFHEESARAAKAQFDTNFAGFSHPAFNIREPSPVLSPLNAVLVPILYLFCEKAGLPFTTLLRVRIGLFTRGARSRLPTTTRTSTSTSRTTPRSTTSTTRTATPGSSTRPTRTCRRSWRRRTSTTESSLSPGASRPRRGAWRRSTAGTTTRACTRPTT